MARYSPVAQGRALFILDAETGTNRPAFDGRVWDALVHAGVRPAWPPAADTRVALRSLLSAGNRVWVVGTGGHGALDVQHFEEGFDTAGQKNYQSLVGEDVANYEHTGADDPAGHDLATWVVSSGLADRQIFLVGSQEFIDAQSSAFQHLGMEPVAIPCVDPIDMGLWDRKLHTAQAIQTSYLGRLGRIASRGSVAPLSR